MRTPEHHYWKYAKLISAAPEMGAVVILGSIAQSPNYISEPTKYLKTKDFHFGFEVKRSHERVDRENPQSKEQTHSEGEQIANVCITRKPGRRLS